MYKTNKTTWGLMCLALILSACGGGGGGGAPADKSSSVQGSAAKGILINADVAAYPLVNGKQGTTPLATTKTNENGDYELKLTPGNEPVIIEVKANATTRMLDETAPLVNGQFAQVAAPLNLVMRSFAANVAQTVSVRVNPYTEMAVAVAANTGSLSLNSLIAGQQVALLASPQDVNPFSQIPAAKPASMDDNQLKFAMQMAGLLSAAKSNPGCDLQCQISQLSKNINLSVGADGRASVPGDVNLALQTQKEAVLRAGAAAVRVEPVQQTRLMQIKTAVFAEAQSAVNTAKAQQSESSQTSSTAEVVAANGLDGFVKAMRNGFRSTESRLLKAEEDLLKRYENVTLESVSFVNQVLTAIEQDCTSSGLVCANRATSSLLWTGGNGSYTWVTAAPDSLGRTSTGTVVGGKGADGRISALVNGSISKNGQPLFTMDNLDIRLMDRGYDNFEGHVNGTVRAKASASDLTVSLVFDNLFFKVNPVKLYEINDVQLKGGLSLSASNGDRLSGSLDLKVVEVYGTQGSSWTNDYDEFVTDGTINLKAVTTASGGSMEILELGVRLTSSLPDYAKPVSSSNVETYNGTVTLALADKQTTLVFTESTASWQTINQVATIQSGGSEVRLSAAFSSTNTNGSWCQWNEIKRCTNQINLTSTNANPYTATLTKGSNGKIKGDIFLGALKVGEFVNGVLKINGTEVSLY